MAHRPVLCRCAPQIPCAEALTPVGGYLTVEPVEAVMLDEAGGADGTGALVGRGQDGTPTRHPAGTQPEARHREPGRGWSPEPGVRTP